MRVLRMVIAYRGRGFRWPFRDTDVLELWSGAGVESEKIAELPASLILEVLRQHLEAALLVQQVGARLDLTVLRNTGHPPRLPAVGPRRLRGYHP